MLSRERGVIELSLAALFFGVMAFAAKRATGEISGAQIAFVRFATGLVVVLGQVVVRRAPLRLVRVDLLLYRGFFGGIAVLLLFLSFGHLPVGTATLLNYTAPVFTAIFAAIFLAESVPALRAAAMVVAGTGVAMVVYGQGQSLGGGQLWMLLGLVSAVCSGAAVTSIRAARRTDGAWEVFGAFCAIGMLTTAPFAIAAWRWPGLGTWMLIVGIGLLATVGQILMTHALAAVDAATAGIIGQLTVVTALALGHFFDGEPFGRTSLLGAGMTLVGVSVVLRAPALRLVAAVEGD